MALQTSGQISLNEIHVEAGGTSGTFCSIDDTDIRGLIDKTYSVQHAFSEWYGASAATVLTSAGTVNGEDQQKQITVSSFISAGGTLKIPSNIWVWSDDRTIAALIIDISCTIINEGKIIGKGGNGGGGNGQSGGPAIKINSGVTGVTITNETGAYIAGGGGGGGSYWLTSKSGGGGGAGGGTGGRGYVSSHGYGTAGVGGALNAKGSNGVSAGNHGSGGGGGAGGGGAGGVGGSGGGGGRQFPGTGGSGGNASQGFASGGAGGAGGNNAPTRPSTYNGGAGGGGGWGANGANDNTGYSGRAGGSGGKAIDDSGVTYTLTNNGTVYGGT